MRFTHEAGKGQASTNEFQNANADQPLQWIVRSASKQAVLGVRVELDGKPVSDLKDRSLPPGGSLSYHGGTEAVICDSAWKELARVPVDAGAARVGTGKQQIVIGCGPQTVTTLKIEVRTLGPATRIGRP
jgi:hypothetical protein